MKLQFLLAGAAALSLLASSALAQTAADTLIIKAGGIQPQEVNAQTYIQTTSPSAVHGTPTTGNCASWFDATHVQDAGGKCGNGVDAQTAVAGAATSTKPNVVVTSEGLTTATTYTLTLADNLITSTSVIQCTPYDGAATGVQITSITPGTHTVAIVVAMAALSGTVKFDISILN